MEIKIRHFYLDIHIYYIHMETRSKAFYWSWRTGEFVTV